MLHATTRHLRMWHANIVGAHGCLRARCQLTLRPSFWYGEMAKAETWHILCKTASAQGHDLR